MSAQSDRASPGASVTPPPLRTFFLRWLAALGLFLPLLYFTLLLDVLLHEVLGHGMVSLLVGGQFRGFAVQLDAGGYALTDDAGSPVAVLAGGMVVNTAIGCACLALGRRRVPGSFLRVWLLRVGVEFVVSAAQYCFWGAYYADDRTDMGRIVRHLDLGVWRFVFLGVSAFTVVATLLAGLRALLFHFQAITGPLSGARLGLVCGAIGVAGVGSSYLYDYTQLVADAGGVPEMSLAGACAFAAIAVAFLPCPTPPVREISTRHWILGWTLSGAACTSMVLLVALLLQDGVSWR